MKSASTLRLFSHLCVDLLYSPWLGPSCHSGFGSKLPPRGGLPWPHPLEYCLISQSLPNYLWNYLFKHSYLSCLTRTWAPRRQRTYLSHPHVYFCIPSGYTSSWYIEGFHKYLLNKQVNRSPNSMKQYNWFFFVFDQERRLWACRYWTQNFQKLFHGAFF